MSRDPSTNDRAEPVASIDEIRERAYDLWDRHHRPEGYDLQFWFMAERELKAERWAMLGDRAGAAADDASSPASKSSTTSEETTH
ncbi:MULTISPECIES: DUF2934 domain-containing protein [unclassified Methylobacterium]|uniref:DUF2934 domain-containing protein n=1 Tax=unclassified Methylobacterium TaxID=2615210 RepID=UPI001FBBFAD9|nr:MULTISPECIES: DUF2934 domain-containing protein [unclassified Methylobacterium]MCJ2092066.1 DUF2934 domain-containing protein [Methylobacterium sp. J-072]MCJ2142523.1 DUF2934 domain-containing protein [Methylobacterium sp. E-066]